jgi:regulatory protein
VAVRVGLSDGSFFIVHAALRLTHCVQVDTELAPEEVTRLQAASESLFARQSALALLARAPHTRKGLALKLRAKGFAKAAVARAISRMTELGYLDDRAFAFAWARQRMDAHAEGWKALVKGLMRRGVDRELAGEAATEACPEEAELEAARKIARGLPPRRAVSRLTARGFRSRAIARVLRELGGQPPQGSAE